jgi:hypothetical protein
MLRTSIFILFVASFAVLQSAHTQVQEEDVVVLKDSTIIRGTITETVTQGSSVTVKRTNGRITSLLWSEILTIKRLPVSMPDSAITALFLQSEPGKKVAGNSSTSIAGGYSSPFGLAARDTSEEDILVLAGGGIVRGTIVESTGKGTVGLWTTGEKLSVYRNSEIQKRLHIAKGTTDSTINIMYINPLPEMIADDFRILTIFGGLSIAGGQFASPTNEGGDPAGSGFGVGLHASVRIIPTVRWATSVMYVKNTMELPSVLAEYTASGTPDPHQLIWVVTGGEVRTEGTSALKAFAFAQGGMLFSRVSQFDVTIPETRNHPSGSGGQGGASSKGFAFCIGGGVSMGRFSLTGRWLTSSASYDYTTTVDFGTYYGKRSYSYTYDQPVSLILISVGFSPL